MTHLYLLVLTGLLIAAAPATAQANPCLSNVDSVANLRFVASLPYRTPDSAATVAEGLPWARYENIQVVTDSVVCAAAIAAFSSFDGSTGTPEATTAAYIFALGGTGYAFIRPGDAAVGGRRRKVFVFSTTWTHKINYLT